MQVSIGTLTLCSVVRGINRYAYFSISIVSYYFNWSCTVRLLLLFSLDSEICTKQLRVVSPQSGDVIFKIVKHGEKARKGTTQSPVV